MPLEIFPIFDAIESLDEFQQYKFECKRVAVDPRCVSICTALHSITSAIASAIVASAMAVWMSLHNNSDVMIYCFHYSIAVPCLPLWAFVRDITFTNDSINGIFGLSGKMQLAKWKSLAFINFTNERLYTSKALKFWRRSDLNRNRCFLFIKYQLVGLSVVYCFWHHFCLQKWAKYPYMHCIVNGACNRDRGFNSWVSFPHSWNKLDLNSRTQREKNCKQKWIND